MQQARVGGGHADVWPATGVKAAPVSSDSNTMTVRPVRSGHLTCAAAGEDLSARDRRMGARLDLPGTGRRCPSAHGGPPAADDARKRMSRSIGTAPALVTTSLRVIPGGEGRRGSVQRALHSVVGTLSAAFPAHNGEQVRDVVYSTYARRATDDSHLRTPCTP